MEIKFRVWDEDNKKWRYDIHLDNNYSESNGIRLSPCFYWKEGNINTSVLSDSDNVSQFIGIRDKKGKEIFTGDILKYVVPAVVTFNDHNFAGLHSFHICDIKGNSLEYYYGMAITSDDEVIGNTKENPELLEE